MTTGLLWSKWWRLIAAVAATIATAAFTVDTAGYVALSSDTLANRTWEFAYPIAAAWASARLVVHTRRRTPDPMLAMFVAGLVLGLMGGFDRFDVITHSEVFSSLPAVWTRIATVLCLGIGIALTLRFTVYLAQLSTGRSPTRSPHPESEPA